MLSSQWWKQLEETGSDFFWELDNGDRTVRNGTVTSGGRSVPVSRLRGSAAATPLTDTARPTENSPGTWEKRRRTSRHRSGRLTLSQIKVFAHSQTLHSLHSPPKQQTIKHNKTNLRLSKVAEICQPSCNFMALLVDEDRNALRRLHRVTVITESILKIISTFLWYFQPSDAQHWDLTSLEQLRQPPWNR